MGDLIEVVKVLFLLYVWLVALIWNFIAWFVKDSEKIRTHQSSALALGWTALAIALTMIMGEV